MIINFICYCYFNTDVAYCMDTNTEMSHLLQEKIAQVQDKMKYFQDQTVQADRDFKEVLRSKTYYENKGALSV